MYIIVLLRILDFIGEGVEDESDEEEVKDSV